MKNAFKTVGLIGKLKGSSVSKALNTIRDQLNARDIELLLYEKTAEHVPDLNITIASLEEIGKRCDLVIIIGGDGTLLNAARNLSNFDVPLAGINLGRLGFLVDISPQDINAKLDEILSGKYMEEKRLLLHAQVKRDGEIIMEADALNDVVIHKWEFARMIELEISINRQHVNTHRSDGLIICTPTGSTAYALSGGGPILHPALHAIALVPICPHALSNRPIVVDADSEIEITVSQEKAGDAQLTCDGQIYHRMEPGDKALIKAKPSKLHLLHPEDYDYYDILRAKLHWAKHS